MRTISQPASASCWTWSSVAAQSSVFVVVIDWTEIGASPPITMLPTLTARVLRRGGNGGGAGTRSVTPDQSGTGGNPVCGIPMSGFTSRLCR